MGMPRPFLFVAKRQPYLRSQGLRQPRLRLLRTDLLRCHRRGFGFINSES